MTTPSLEQLRADATELLARLRTERDELAVQIHLARAEAREEWEKLQPRWEHFQARAREVAETAEDSSREVGAALGLLGEELKRGFQRIRDTLRS